jgi:putative transposase
VKRTVVFPQNLSEGEKTIFLETRALYIKACQMCIDVAWELEKCNGILLHKLTYQKVKSETGLPSQLVCSARNKALEIVKSAKALLEKGKKVSKPVVKNVWIRLDVNSLSFDKNRSNASILTLQGRRKISLHWHKHAVRYKDWDCKAGEFGFNKNGKLELRLVFEKIVEKPKQTGRVVGIDRGIKKPVVTSSNQFLGKKCWKAKEEEYLFLIRRLQAKGTKSAKRHLKKISGGLTRFKKDCDYVLAKEFIADLQPGDTIVCEDLTYIRERCGSKRYVNKKLRRWIGRWSFKRLENCILAVAEVKGVYVVYVDPRYTSQTCSRCGIICKNNRKNQSSYVCRCGCKLNADLNAARNIAYKWCIANGFTPRPPVNRPIVATASKRSG